LIPSAVKHQISPSIHYLILGLSFLVMDQGQNFGGKLSCLLKSKLQHFLLMWTRWEVVYVVEIRMYAYRVGSDIACFMPQAEKYGIWT